MSNKPKGKVTGNQPSQQEMFETVLRENAMLRQQLTDKSTYETMEQLKIFVDIAKSNLFTGDPQEYILNKIKEVILPMQKEVVEKEHSDKEAPVKEESGF